MKKLILILACLFFGYLSMAQYDNTADVKYRVVTDLPTNPATGLGVMINGYTLVYDGSAWDTLNGGGSSTGGASSIDDLTDAISDGSSLFFGVNSGVTDDGTDNRNVGIGTYSLYLNTSGAGNSAYGRHSLFNNTTGAYNVAIGQSSMEDNVTGGNNVAVGNHSFYGSTGGFYNVAIGNRALMNGGINSSNNTVIGHQSFYNGSGSNNTALGFEAGFGNDLGSGNLFLGYMAGKTETGSNKLYIENSNSASPLIYGDFGTNSVTINGDLDVTGTYTGFTAEDDDSGGEPVTLTELSTLDDLGASQAVYSDGVYLYTTGNGPGINDGHRFLMKWTKEGVLVDSIGDARTQGTDMTQVNGMCIKEDTLFVSSNAYPVSTSFIKMFDPETLEYLGEHSVRSETSEQATWHDGYWWVIYNDLKTVDKYNEQWVYQTTYPLSYTISGSFYYQSVIWIDDYILCNIHDGTAAQQSLDIYKWNGSGFDEVRRIPSLNPLKAGQGISKEPGKNILWVAERHVPTNQHNVIKARINYILNGPSNNVLKGAKTASFTHDADDGDIGAYTLSTSSGVTISIHNLKDGMQGTLFLDIATLPSSITVNTYSDAGTTGLTEVSLGTVPTRAGSKATTITYTCADNGTTTQVYLVYSQEQ